MITLTEVTEENWFDVAGLSVKDDQKNYVAPAIGILARGFVYRDCNSRIYVIEKGKQNLDFGKLCMGLLASPERIRVI